MLKICKDFFRDMDTQDIEYIIYKGYDHLEEDMCGERGDLDFTIISKYSLFEELLAKYGVKLDIRRKNPFYGLLFDLDTHKEVMLDFDSRVNCGKRAFFPYYFYIDKLNAVTHPKLACKVLDEYDYAFMLLILGLMSDKPKVKNIEKIRELFSKISYKDSPINNILNISDKDDYIKLIRYVQSFPDWHEIKSKYKNIVKNNIYKDYLTLFLGKFNFFIKPLRVVSRRLAGMELKIRKKGFLVAFVGVDGAGKSSTVEYVKNLPYFKRTGLKSMYFGNNHYWIPGLTKLVAKKDKGKKLKFVVGVLSRFDRQLRILGALFYMWRGNIVLADRYFYDDQVSRKRKGAVIYKSKFRQFISFILRAHMLKKPELTIFLDVSPDVAYARKQDYDFETMLSVNKAYKEHMLPLPEVIRIDADQPQEAVLKGVVETIYKFDKEW